MFPGRDSSREREYTDDEIEALLEGGTLLGFSLEQMYSLFGGTTMDVPLNEVAYWSNVPLHVWNFTASGYLVLKKWLSYRETDVLGRTVTPERRGAMAREVGLNVKSRRVADVTRQYCM